MKAWFGRKPSETTSIAIESDASSTNRRQVAAAEGQVQHSNLPVPLSSLIDRIADIHAVTGLLRTDRLLTLTGPGGIGKTRLAIAVASDRRADVKDGAWMSDLSGVGDPQLVAKTVASAVGVPDEPGRAPIDSLRQHLVGRSQLIVVDNCEHVISGAAEVIDSVLQRCPGIR